MVKGLIILSRNLDSTEMTKAYNTHKLKTIISHFAAKIQNPKSLKRYMLFSGDEVNMMALLKAFRLLDYSCLSRKMRSSKYDETLDCRNPPSPSSSLVFELVRNNTSKEYFVRVIYNGIEVKICANFSKVFCPWREWRELIKADYILNSFFEVCGNEKVSLKKNESTKEGVEASLIGSWALV